MNAFTAREHTAFYARLPARAAWRSGVEVLADVLTAPALRPAEVEAERQVIVEEILMNLDAPEDRVHTALSRGALRRPPARARGARRDAHRRGDHPRRHRGVLRALVPPRHHGHHRRRPPRPRRRSSPPSAARLRRRGGRRAARRGWRPARRRSHVVVEHDDTEQAHLCLGWRSLANHDDDRWALSVANQVLGGGMASRLFQEVREERGLAYSVYSHPTAFADSGYLTIYCGTAPKRAREALAVIDDVLAVRAGRRHHRAGARRRGRLPRGLDAPRPRGQRQPHGPARAAASCSATRSRRSTSTSPRLRAVTADDVSRVLHRVLDTPRTLAASAPSTTTP